MLLLLNKTLPFYHTYPSVTALGWDIMTQKIWIKCLETQRFTSTEDISDGSIFRKSDGNIVSSHKRHKVFITGYLGCKLWMVFSMQIHLKRIEGKRFGKKTGAWSSSQNSGFWLKTMHSCTVDMTTKVPADISEHLQITHPTIQIFGISKAYTVSCNSFDHKVNISLWKEVGMICVRCFCLSSMDELQVPPNRVRFQINCYIFVGTLFSIQSNSGTSYWCCISSMQIEVW
jgi:hypothetical protein